MTNLFIKSPFIFIRFHSFWVTRRRSCETIYEPFKWSPTFAASIFRQTGQRLHFICTHVSFRATPTRARIISNSLNRITPSSSAHTHTHTLCASHSRIVAQPITFCPFFPFTKKCTKSVRNPPDTSSVGSCSK